VEDDEALRRTAQLTLERAGHRVLAARDGQDALELAARDGSFTLLVTDVVMPRLGGPQCAAALRAGRRELPVLYVSGYVHEGEALDLKAPRTALLAKPYAVSDLLDAVDRLAAGPRREPGGTAPA
jgi:CheY-like chemotaxis protein